MCGRYTLTRTPKDELNRVGIRDPFDIPPRYNISPGQQVPAVVNEPELNGRRIMRALEWGLIPPWTKDMKSAKRLINARAETIDSKPSFKAAARHRRCLLPADGFYEWARTSEGRQPYYIHLADKSPFFLAGLWEQWDGPNGEAVDSCTVVTTAPNMLVREVHDRMPVILTGAGALKWMDESIQRVSLLTELFSPYSEEEMFKYPVGPRVNSPSHDDADCIAPAAETNGSASPLTLL